MTDGSNYTVTMTDGRQVLFYDAPVAWKAAVTTFTSDPYLGVEEISFSEIWRVSRPFLMLAFGWGIGVATGALGLVWILHQK